MMQKSGVVFIRDALTFLDIASETAETKRLLRDAIVPLIPAVIDKFYARIQNSPLSQYLDGSNIARLKTRQIEHWTKLFSSQFEEAFMGDAMRIALRHREIGLSSAWYVVAYSAIKLEFLDLVAASNWGPVTKGKLMRVVSRYIAADMAIALAAYDMILVD